MPVVFASGVLFCFGFRFISRSGVQEKAAMIEMERLNILFEDAIAAIEDGFVLYDSDDRMFICNDPFRSQFPGVEHLLEPGLTYEAQIKSMAHSGFIPGVEGKEDDFVASLLAKRQSDFGVVRVFETNDGRWIRQRDKKTAAGNVVGLRTDVTELKKNEKMLEAAREQAEAAVRAKAAFLANMSHEIRTPMNGIIGMAELLQDTQLDEDQHMFTRTVIESCTALQSIVNDILDFSKVEAGKMEVRAEPFDLAECIHNVAALLAPTAAEKGIEICSDVRDEENTWFLGDSGRIRQILINLVGNALKFTPSGFVLIRLTVDPETGAPSLLIKDTGIGIPPYKLQSIFSAFEQVDNETTRQFDGTGLGLAITHRLVGVMGGDIQVTSELDEGSEFHVALPLPGCEPEAGEPVATRDIPDGLRVLVVDDLEINRLILERNLDSWGARHTSAASGLQTLELLRAGAQFDVAIFDFQMPGMDGLELLKTIRADTTIAHFPVIMLSSVERGVTNTEEVQRLFDVVMLKPARAEILKSSTLKLVAPKRPVKLAQPHAQNHGDTSLSGVRILVAEDNRTNQLVIGRILENQGAEVQICANGADAVDAFFESRPGLVLMDVSMPVMNGFEATKAIRSREGNGPPVPIIALTANAMPEDRTRCLEAGMSDFLSKPMRKARALEVIAMHIPPRFEAKRANG